MVAYLEGLAQAGHHIRLLTFEPGRMTRAERRRRSEELGSRGVAWHALRYHKRPSLPATLYDSVLGAAVIAFLARRHRIDVVHARSHVPAAMALIALQVTRAAMIFDIRGLWAEEYRDAGRWQQTGLAYRITKWVQRKAIDRADGIVVLTERVRELLFGTTEDPRVVVIPCCADLEAIAAADAERETMRTRLGVAERLVLVYVGKFGGWYMEREMVDFFTVARQTIDELYFLILTQEDPAPIARELERRGIDAGDFAITSAEAQDVGSYLAAADAGIAFIRPAPSKVSSSPTKIGEYLAAGLPVVASAGVGDVDELLRATRVGGLVSDFSEQGYARGAEALLALIEDPDCGARCRAAAAAELSLTGVGRPRYADLYELVGATSPRV